jgi:hypothetical protein
MLLKIIGSCEFPTALWARKRLVVRVQRPVVVVKVALFPEAAIAKIALEWRNSVLVCFVHGVRWRWRWSRRWGLWRLETMAAAAKDDGEADSDKSDSAECEDTATCDKRC